MPRLLLHPARPLRAVLTRVGFVGGDMMFVLFIATMLLGLFTPLFPVVTLGGVVVWGFTVITVNRYLHGLPSHVTHEGATPAR